MEHPVARKETYNTPKPSVEEARAGADDTDEEAEWGIPPFLRRSKIK
jgi:hypothetical protein